MIIEEVEAEYNPAIRTGPASKNPPPRIKRSSTVHPDAMELLPPGDKQVAVRISSAKNCPGRLRSWHMEAHNDRQATNPLSVAYRKKALILTKIKRRDLPTVEASMRAAEEGVNA